MLSFLRLAERIWRRSGDWMALLVAARRKLRPARKQ